MQKSALCFHFDVLNIDPEYFNSRIKLQNMRVKPLDVYSESFALHKLLKVKLKWIDAVEWNQMKDFFLIFKIYTFFLW